MAGTSAAFLIARLLLGGSLAAHGSQKLCGWFGGGGPKGTAAFLEGLGFRPGYIFAIASGLGELLGGLLTLLGLGGAIGPVLIILVMLVAIFSVHITKGFFSSGGGWELPGINIAAALAIAFGGNRDYSIDAAIGLHFLRGWEHIWIAIGCAVVLAALNLLARRPAR
ncbi:MAG: DoxX family protein [Candidatus Tyrphobacter sp.]